MIQVAILGATGYTGAELLRLVSQHPYMQVSHACAHSHAGKKVNDVLPNMHGELAQLTLASVDDPIPENIELVFIALPHGAAAKYVARALDANIRVVDLSADFRHPNLKNYQDAYGQPHPYPKLLDKSVYGLSEIAKDDLQNAHLVANPGCYPTSVLLPLVPLLRAGLVDSQNIIIDSKSGTSGAGRGAQLGSLFCEVNESLKAYGLPRHRHSWEMEEWAQNYGNQDVHIRFTPHLIPMTRGMLSTLHLRGNNTQLWHKTLSDYYQDSLFVKVYEHGRLPAVNAVNRSNRCDIGLQVLSDSEVTIVSCIDNLMKGAAGQAIQNANIMLGLNESLGLSQIAVWP
ncbi:MAG: N-acetyl-gamma-glutamyl-phosphate reductase [Mariprofundaceae bacterium]|nr:N-acetyl-gamma-glutamyl-phosphate reductase [Mariprofundaceae bacterium]